MIVKEIYDEDDILEFEKRMKKMIDGNTTI